MKKVVSIILLSALFMCACGNDNSDEMVNVTLEKKGTWEVELLGNPLATKSYNSKYDSEIIVNVDASNPDDVLCTTCCTTLKAEKAKEFGKLQDADKVFNKDWFNNNVNVYSRGEGEWKFLESKEIQDECGTFYTMWIEPDYNESPQYYGRITKLSDDGEEMNITYNFYREKEGNFEVDASFSVSGKTSDSKYPVSVKRTSEHTALAVCSDGCLRQYDLLTNELIAEFDESVKMSLHAFGTGCIATYDSVAGGVKILDDNTFLTENTIKLDEKIDETKQQAKVAVFDDEVYLVTPEGFYVADRTDKKFVKQDCSYNLASVMTDSEQTYFSNFHAYEDRAYLCMEVKKDSGDVENLIYSFVKETE